VPKNKLTLVLLIVIGFIFGSAGLMKTFSEPGMVERMNSIHFGTAWRYFIGVTELLGVAALFHRSLRATALLCLWPYAVGGLAVHIAFGHPVSRLVPAVIAGLLIPIALWLDGYLFLRQSQQLLRVKNQT
jgi:uncharacterized membrane protein YphA (DoxX/SURF4 family)